MNCYATCSHPKRSEENAFNNVQNNYVIKLSEDLYRAATPVRFHLMDIAIQSTKKRWGNEVFGVAVVVVVVFSLEFIHYSHFINLYTVRKKRRGCAHEIKSRKEPKWWDRERARGRERNKKNSKMVISLQTMNCFRWAKNLHTCLHMPLIITWKNEAAQEDEKRKKKHVETVLLTLLRRLYTLHRKMIANR